MVESVSQLADVGGQPALAGLKDALFGFGEAGEIELVGERVQITFGLSKAGLQLSGRRPQRRDRGLTRLRSAVAGIAQQGRASEGVRGHAPGGEKGPGLSGAKGVTPDRLGQRLLLGARNARQAAGHGGGETTIVDVAPELGAEALAKGQTSIDPRPPPVQEFGDLGG